VPYKELPDQECDGEEAPSSLSDLAR
jgi:hypothetical protein